MLRWSALLAVVAFCLPLLESTTAAVSASPRTTPPIGTQLAELRSTDAAGGSDFGSSVAISGTTVAVASERAGPLPLRIRCVFPVLPLSPHH